MDDTQETEQDGQPETPPPDNRKQALGKYGESVAARHLVAAGMVLLEQNFTTAMGEVDLLLRDGDVLVACEVKTRSSDACGLPHEAVDAGKVQRLRHVAEQWVACHAADPRDLRVDLVAVTRPLKGPAFVEHVRGIG